MIMQFYSLIKIPIPLQSKNIFFDIFEISDSYVTVCMYMQPVFIGTFSCTYDQMEADSHDVFLQ